MSEPRKCKICGNEFTPDKYHPRQEICSNPDCQHQRQLKNQQKWRGDNPDYFTYKEKSTIWEKKRAQYLKNWRQAHKGYFRNYRQKKRLTGSGAPPLKAEAPSPEG